MVIHFLAENPKCQDRARAEVSTLFSPLHFWSDHRLQALQVVSNQKCPDFEEQKKLDYIGNCIKEGLRIYPPVAALPSRELTKDIEVLLFESILVSFRLVLK